MRTPQEVAEYIVTRYVTMGYTELMAVSEAIADVAAYAYGMYDAGDFGRKYWSDVMEHLLPRYEELRHERGKKTGQNSGSD